MSNIECRISKLLNHLTHLNDGLDVGVVGYMGTELVSVGAHCTFQSVHVFKVEVADVEARWMAERLEGTADTYQNQ